MILQYKIAILDLYGLQKNCHIKPFVTISGVTITEKDCTTFPQVLSVLLVLQGANPNLWSQFGARRRCASHCQFKLRCPACIFSKSDTSAPYHEKTMRVSKLGLRFRPPHPQVAPYLQGGPPGREQSFCRHCNKSCALV